jgi:NitT/TauT family transport system permease protein
MKSAVPIATVVLALFAVWYVAAALMNASLQRDQFANAGRADYSTQDLVGASLNMERPKLPAPHQVANSTSSSSSPRRPRSAASSIMGRSRSKRR